MKGYVVTLTNLQESVDVANRCIKTAKEFNVDVEIFPAVHKNISFIEMDKQKLKLSSFDTSYSNLKAVVGNFVSQFKIWKKIKEQNEPGIVLEHDAVFVREVPTIVGDIVNIGAPSFGKYNEKEQSGEYPLFSKNGGYFPGAHGYFVTPTGAEQLIEKAIEIGVAPCDVFLNKKNFPNLREVYPWVVEAHDTFSTIQRKKGCIAKHNFNNDYKTL